ncbi:hypothetical protein [Aquimarina sp. 2304DJ70-9]|uniref:hypothetical protein n=1 Tax=Aquimarina penaris TaxID=3231044 RepID=UPI00346210DC
MKRNFFKKYLVLNWLMFSVVAFSNAQHSLTLRKGVVIDSLTVPDTNNSFSIYLPKAFDMQKSWPILFGFDSSGKASHITHLYKEAAEQNGYIIVASNFSEALNDKEKTNYVTSLMNHIFSLLPIQKNRVYVTAIRKDTKLVSLLPVLYNNDIFGVIAIGDSYYYDSSIKIKSNFSYLGIVNTNSFRYKDFLRNKSYLKRKNVQADVLAYDGKSELPPPDIFTKALSTFTLHAMGNKRIPVDSTWIQSSFQSDLKMVESHLKERKFLEAYNDVKRIRTKYEQFFDTSFLKEKQKEIRRTKGYKKEKQLYTKYVYRENFFRQTYLFSLQEDVIAKSYENLDWWQYQVSELDTLALSKEKYAYEVASRTKGYLKHLVDNYKIAQIPGDKSFEKRMFLNILSTVVDNKDYESYLEIISLSAVDQDYETALFYLEKLLQNGYKDFDRLYAIEGTLALRMSKEYNILVEKHLGKAKYFFSK